MKNDPKATINAKLAREQMQNGIVLRAQTFKNRKREASRKACRKGNW